MGLSLSPSVKIEQDQENVQYEMTQAAAHSLSLTDQEGSQSVSAHLGGASGGEGGGGNQETTYSQALSDLQSENRELREKLETLEEEKEKADSEMNKLRNEVETLKSENKRHLEVIKKITSGADAGVDENVEMATED